MSKVEASSKWKFFERSIFSRDHTRDCGISLLAAKTHRISSRQSRPPCDYRHNRELSYADTMSGERRANGRWKRRFIRMFIHPPSEVSMSPHCSFAGGRIKAGCDLISQYIPVNTYTVLLASYEFVFHLLTVDFSPY
jgi:hypothetical protein